MKLPTIWRVEKQSRDEKQRREVESEERRDNFAKVSRKKIDTREMTIRCVFSMICVSAGSKSRLAKAAGAEVAAQSRQEKLHAAVARSSFSVKMYKIARVRTTLGSCDVEKWHAAVARSTFASQNAKKTDSLSSLLEVEMSKNGTPLWREAYLQVKMLKT